MATYTYSVASDFSGQAPNVPKLNSEIRAEGGIVTALNGTVNHEDVVNIFFATTLSGGEVTLLNSVIAAHDNSLVVVDTINMENKRLINVAVPIQSMDGVPFNVVESLFTPIITIVSPSHIPVNDTVDFDVNGYNFTPGTTVTIVGQTVNSVTFTNPTCIKVNATTSATPGDYDMTIVNEVGEETFADAVTTLVITWIDLRDGGETLNVGTDVRVRSGMSVVRDSGGMYFTGLNPWGSWVKFERADFQWPRGDNRTLSWIFTRPDAAVMFGIGSGATNEANNAQYTQGEILSYFTNGTNMWGFYGNNGSPGVSGSQSVSQSISGGSGVYKMSFTNDGSSGGTFTLYELPDANFGSWEDVSTVLRTTTTTLTPAQSPIFPFIIPRSGGSMRFIAFKIQ